MIDLATARGRALHGLGAAAVWLAVCFLGYWVARLVGDVLVQACVRPWFGARIETWRLAPLRVSVIASVAELTGPARTALFLLPPLLLVAGPAAIALTGSRLGRGATAAVLHLAGFWMMLFALSHVASLAASASAPLAWLLGPLGGVAPARLGLAIVLLAGLVVSGAVAARRAVLLLRGERRVARGSEPQSDERHNDEAPLHGDPPRRPWGALAGLVGSLAALLAAGAGLRLGWLRHAGSAWLYVPLAFVAAVGALGLARRIVSAPPPLRPRPRALLGILAALLCAGLALVQPLRSWAGARSQARVATAHVEVLFSTPRFDAARMQRFAESCETILERVRARLASPAEARMRVVAYADLDDKRAAIQGDGRPTLDGTTVHAVIDPEHPALDPALAAEIACRAAWGAPGTPLLGSWTAYAFADAWREAPLDAWVAQIQEEEGRIELTTLLDPASDADLSPLVRTPLGAAWMSHVAAVRGIAAANALYALSDRGLAAAARALATTPEALAADWRAWSDTLVARTDVTDLERWRPDPFTFLRGVSLSHEGFRGGGGYDSRRARAQLEQLRARGVNAVTLVPYAFMRGTDDGTIAYTRTDESDAELVAGLRAAHALGLRVMLKPQIWVGHGRFTGDIRIADAAARGRWMRSYRRFALHYARLAELEGFDLLCLGTELGGMTHHTSEWRSLVRDLRRVYHGPLTYAAHWRDEIATIGWWDALDFIGVNDYAPLASSNAEGEAAMTARAAATAKQLENLALRWRRPVLLTEIGYASVAGCAVEPWSESGTLDLAAQARAYHVALATYARAPWLRGMFWWKWHSSGASPQDASFSPQGKPAADTLRVWYARLAAEATRTAARALTDTIPHLKPDTTASPPRDITPQPDVPVPADEAAADSEAAASPDSAPRPDSTAAGRSAHRP